jgi:two-component system, NarL family, sensor histidine kinase LiaS
MPSAAVQLLIAGVAQARCRKVSPRLPARVGPRPHAPRSLPRANLPGTAKQTSADADAALLQERAPIARELHDSVSQTLYAITLTASRAMRLLEQNEANEVQHMIDGVLHLANAGQSELRALLTNLRSDRRTSGGLTAGLTHLAADVQTRNGLDIRLSLADERDLRATTKEALFLITREALHNVVKHASADRVDIVLEVEAEELILLITDNGRGFDPVEHRPGHFGLHSMRERAAAVGGMLELVSAVGRGTQVRVSLPVRAERDG